MNISVEVAARDSGLRRALAHRLDAWPDFVVVAEDEGDSAAVLITLAHESSPAACALRVARGCAVVVLATVVREAERRAFLEAGAAAYLAMDLDLPRLGRAIEEAHQTSSPGSRGQDSRP